MKKSLSAKEIFELKPADRGKAIMKAAEIATDSDDLQTAKRISSVLNLFLPDYFAIAIEHDKSRKDGSILSPLNLSIAIDNKIGIYKPLAIDRIKEALASNCGGDEASCNIYEMAGCSKLAGANKVTRNLSTTLGMLWEEIACISPYVVNPEREFNLKVRGVDLISLVGGNTVEYQQLKTQRNTLTGSQKPRSENELKIHANSSFCVCFALSSWTFQSKIIPRYDGPRFWPRIGIDYNLLVTKASQLLRDLEKEYCKS